MPHKMPELPGPGMQMVHESFWIYLSICAKAGGLGLPQPHSVSAAWEFCNTS